MSKAEGRTRGFATEGREGSLMDRQEEVKELYSHETLVNRRPIEDVQVQGMSTVLGILAAFHDLYPKKMN